MATAAAPTYFPAHRLRDRIELVDGGIWANNPILVAAVEATAVLDWPTSDILILSLGCTDQRLVVPPKMGLVNAASMCVPMLLQGQSVAALSTAKILLGGGNTAEDRLKRVNVTVDRGFAQMDNAESIPQLEGLGNAEARTWLPQIRKEFLTKPRKPFEPFHQLEKKP